MKPVLVIKSPLRQQYLDYLDEVMYNPHPGFHSMRVQPTDYNSPAEARALTTPENVNFQQSMKKVMGKDAMLPLSITEMGHTEPLMGRHVYPFQAYSMAPNLFGGGAEADLPRSYKVGRQNRPRNLQMYAFEGRDTTPQRFANNLQTEGIIYGDVDESNIMPVFNKPVTYADLRVAAQSLLPTSGYTPDELSQKRQSIARQMMNIGLPPVLTDEHLMIPDMTDPHALDSIRDDTRQWSQNQQRLNIPTEDLLYAGEPMDIAMRLLKFEEAWHPKLGSVLSSSLDDMYVDLTSMYGNHPRYEGMSAIEMHDDIDRQIRERLDSQGHDPNPFNAWVNGDDEHYGEIDDEQKSALKQAMLDIMEEHEGGKTIHHNDFSEKYASEPMDLSWRLLKMPLIPESIKRVSDNRAEAQFQDPKTNQVYPMVAEKNPKFGTMNVGIYPNQPGQNLGAPTGLDAMDMTDKDIDDDVKEMLGLGLSNAELTETNEDGPYYESDMTWTDPERRRRGYATALYDLVDALSERKVRPSDNQTDKGKQLWRKRMLPKSEPMDIAFRLLKGQYFHPSIRGYINTRSPGGVVQRRHPTRLHRKISRDDYDTQAEYDDIRSIWEDHLFQTIPQIELPTMGRQTTLGEHHPDFPSPYGPVVYVHGTKPSNIPSIQRHGLNAGHGWYKGNFVSTNPDVKEIYGDNPMRGGIHRNLSGKGALVGIRAGAGTPEPYFGFENDEQERYFPYHWLYTKDIDPKFLVNMGEEGTPRALPEFYVDGEPPEFPEGLSNFDFEEWKSKWGEQV